MTKTKQGQSVGFRNAQTEAWLSLRTKAGASLGLAARRQLDRYADALAREQGGLGLSFEEWEILKIVTLSRHFGESGPYHLHYGVLDAVESGEVSGPAVSTLLAKLKALTPLQELAVVDMLEGLRRDS